MTGKDSNPEPFCVTRGTQKATFRSRKRRRPSPLPAQSLQPVPVPTPAPRPPAGRDGTRPGRQQLYPDPPRGPWHAQLHRSDVAGLRAPWSRAGLSPVPAHPGPPSAPGPFSGFHPTAGPLLCKFTTIIARKIFRENTFQTLMRQKGF